MSPRVMTAIGFAIACATASSAFAQLAAKPPKEARSSVMAIAGMPTSARHCVTKNSANIHPIGWVASGTRVTVTFSSDFDPVAGVTNLKLGSHTPGGSATYAVDDDGGGNLEPELRFTTSQSGNLALFVADYNGGAGGCYRYKVEIQEP